MGLPQGAMIVSREKYDVELFDSYLGMLRHRAEVRNYYDGDDRLRANTIIAASESHDYCMGVPRAVRAVENMAEKFLHERREYEYEGYDVRTPIMRPTSPGSGAMRPTSA